MVLDGIFDLFGKKNKKVEQKSGETFAPPTHDDGAIQIETNETGIQFAGSQGYVFDLDNVPSDEVELLTTYRELALQPDVDEAVQEICNEAIITDEFKQTVAIVLDEVETSDAIKNKVRDEFDHILKLLKFKNDGYGIFRKWYVDGKLYYHKVTDKNNSKKGIVDLVQIEPLHIKLVREIKKKQKGVVDIYDLSQMEEYFIYSGLFTGRSNSNQVGGQNNNQGLRINRDAITYVPSGVMSADGKTVLSHLYKSIKPYNNLKLMEDSVVIYRVTRAPERRIFYVDVGNLPKGKADQYLKDVMNRFKNKIVYDVSKGTINNRKKFQSMMEDYWLPRREGGKGTEVSTLPGGDNLGELDDVEYFKTKLYKSLNVPLSRFQQDGSTFNLGRTSEITRDEIKFSKFINRLRKKFSHLFDDLLRTQLLLKNIITPEDWEDWKDQISYDFLEDNYFQELKEAEILKDRLETLEFVQRTEIVGKYVSHDYVRREILKQTEEEIKEQDKKIDEEAKDERWNDMDEDGDGGWGSDEPAGDDQLDKEPQQQQVVLQVKQEPENGGGEEKKKPEPKKDAKPAEKKKATDKKSE